MQESLQFTENIPEDKVKNLGNKFESIQENKKEINECLLDADCVNKKFAKLEEWDKG